MSLLRPFAIAALLAPALAALPAAAAESLAVIGAGDPPAGPDADLAELTHQLRAACRDRVGNVVDVPTMRAKLLGQLSNATLGELDRAYGGALAVYQNGEFDSAIRTLRAIVEDLEGLPESEEAYVQWRRALLRLAHAATTVGRDEEADEALLKLLRVEPGFRPDPDQYSPAYRRRFDELRLKVKAMPTRRLAVGAEGKAGTVFVNGRPMGGTPLVLQLPAGAYRLGGASGALHVPSFVLDLGEEDRAVVLDFALAASLRVNAGPGLALAPAGRAYGIVRAGAWLGVDKLVVASRTVEGDAQFLLGGLYDVRRGALLREGSVRMVAGTVPSANLGALAAFLLTGQTSREVKQRTETPREIPLALPAIPPSPSRGYEPVKEPELAVAAAPAAASPSIPSAAAPATKTQSRAASATPSAAPTATKTAPATPPAATTATKTASAVPSSLGLSALGLSASPESEPSALATITAPPPAAPARADLRPRSWKRTAMWISGGLALGFAGVATQQGLAASSASGDADAMLGADGALLAGANPGRYRDLRASADSSSRNAWISAGAAVALAATAGVLGWSSWGGSPDAAPLALRF